MFFSFYLFHVGFVISMVACTLFRDYIDSGSVYILADSGGEVGVPYETYFPMPTPAKDKPWYSIEQGSVHITVISTEHEWSQNSEQVKIKQSILYIVPYLISNNQELCF